MFNNFLWSIWSVSKPHLAATADQRRTTGSWSWGGINKVPTTLTQIPSAAMSSKTKEEFVPVEGVQLQESSAHWPSCGKHQEGTSSHNAIQTYLRLLVKCWRPAMPEGKSTRTQRLRSTLYGSARSSSSSRGGTRLPKTDTVNEHPRRQLTSSARPSFSLSGLIGLISFCRLSMTIHVGEKVSECHRNWKVCMQPIIWPISVKAL